MQLNYILFLTGPGYKDKQNIETSKMYGCIKKCVSFYKLLSRFTEFKELNLNLKSQRSEVILGAFMNKRFHDEMVLYTTETIPYSQNMNHKCNYWIGLIV